MFARESDTPQSSSSSPQPQSPPRRETTGGQPAPNRSQGNGEPTHVGAGARLEGRITGDTDVTVDGTVDGEIRLRRDVTVGKSGSVKGSIEARRVRIAGTVEGDVKGKDVVEILPSGRLIGDVVAPSMVIADGAFFKGSVEMTGTEGS
ncbi:MAG: polymer-forming cytoskeletal protein [Thermoanaerobaculia bacterium]